MAQEFTINSSTIEQKINQLLPSQGGNGAGIDFSASTMVIPIVDLTESAEGSQIRQDLQTALSLTTANVFNVRNTTTTLIQTTGYWRVFGNSCIASSTTTTISNQIQITDGITTKEIYEHRMVPTTSVLVNTVPFDFNVFLEAGDSLVFVSGATTAILSGSVRQLANITGGLTDA